VRGSFDVPDYLGSRSTFTLGRFGGHGGRALRAGDVLRLTSSAPGLDDCHATPLAARPNYSQSWKIGVTDGPHGAPDLFTPDDMRAFFDAEWEVH
jgi:urea carboxylase